MARFIAPLCSNCRTGKTHKVLEEQSSSETGRKEVPLCQRWTRAQHHDFHKARSSASSVLKAKKRIYA